jgi:uncharacterized membrane protein
MCWLVVVALTPLACASATTLSNDDGMLEAHDSVAGAGSSGETTSRWCDVARLLERRCQTCHSEPPAHGAPFALVSYADTQVLDRRGRTRYSLIEQVVSRDEMPPTFIELDPPVMPLLADEKQLLLDWCAAGAPADDTCQND